MKLCKNCIHFNGVYRPECVRPIGDDVDPVGAVHCIGRLRALDAKDVAGVGLTA